MSQSHNIHSGSRDTSAIEFTEFCDSRKGRSPPLEVLLGCGVVNPDPSLELLAPDGEHFAKAFATAAASLLIASECSHMELGLGGGKGSFGGGGGPRCPEGRLLLRAIGVLCDL